MIDLGSYPAVDGSFPSVTTLDNTTPTSNDGTPLRKLLVDDIFGMFQAIASQGGITPSGINETYDDSDLVNGIRNISGGPGELVLFCGDLALLYGSNKRLLQCIGQSVLISSYPELVEATYRGDIYNSSSPAFYKSSDSGGITRSTSGPYFILPDCRGRFIRGYDNGGGIDPDVGRLPWEQQESAIKEHSHSIRSVYLGSSYKATLSNAILSGSGDNVLEMYTDGSELKADDFSGENEDETRPINMNPIICVRY